MKLFAVMHGWILNIWAHISNIQSIPLTGSHFPTHKKELELSQLLYSFCDRYDERSGNDG
jgi:hypothetical protein